MGGDTQKDLKIVISSDSNQAESDIQGFGGSLVTMGATAVAAGEILADLAEKVVELGKQFLQSGIDAAAGIEHISTNLNNLIGNQATTQLLDQLEQLSYQTPFTADKFDQLALKMAASHVPAKQIQGDLADIADIAAGTGGNLDQMNGIMDSVTQALSVASERGVISSLQLRTIANQNIPIYDAMAEILNKNAAAAGHLADITGSELTKSNKDVIITFNDLQAAIQLLSETKYADMALEQSKTYDSAMKNLDQVTVDTFRDILGVSEDGTIQVGSLFDMLKKGLTTVLEFIQANKDNIVNFFKNLIATVKEFCEFVRTNFDFVVNGFKSLASVMGMLIALNLSSFLASIVGGLMQLLYPLLNLIATLNPFVVLVVAVSLAISGFITYLQRLEQEGILSKNVVTLLQIALSAIVPVIMIINALLNANPIGAIIIAVGLLTVGIIQLYTQTDFLKTKTQLVTQAQKDLKTAQDNLKKSTDDLAGAQEDLGKANLHAREAAIVVKDAQDAYNAAVKAGGDQSPAAVKAEQELEEAHYNQKDANDAVTKAAQNVIDKQNALMQSQSAEEKASDNLKEKINSQKTVWDNLSSAIQTAIGWLDQAAKKGAFGQTIQSLDQIITGKKAGGGYASGMTLVGEQGPELVDLPSGSYVHTNTETKNMMGGTTVNIYNPSVRQDSDITDIVNQIKRVLGRDNELAKLGAI